MSKGEDEQRWFGQDRHLGNIVTKPTTAGLNIYEDGVLAMRLVFSHTIGKRRYYEVSVVGGKVHDSYYTLSQALDILRTYPKD